MTTSDSDGESLNAMRRVNKMLKAEKLTWESLLGGLSSSNNYNVRREAYTRATRASGPPQHENCRSNDNPFGSSSTTGFGSRDFAKAFNDINNVFKDSFAKERQQTYTYKDRGKDSNEAEPDNYAEFDNGTEEVTFFNMDDDELEAFLKGKCTSVNSKEKQVAHELLESFNEIGSFYHLDRVIMDGAWSIKR